MRTMRENTRQSHILELLVGEHEAQVPEPLGECCPPAVLAHDQPCAAGRQLAFRLWTEGAQFPLETHGQSPHLWGLMYAASAPPLGSAQRLCASPTVQSMSGPPATPTGHSQAQHQPGSRQTTRDERTNLAHLRSRHGCGQ